MNALTAEWVSKAEGDYATAGRELHVEDRPNFDRNLQIFHPNKLYEEIH